jgi:hypothetical protein
LLGAGEAVRAAFGFVLPREVRRGQEPVAIAARGVLGEAAFDSLYAEGINMTPEQAVEYALADEVGPHG